MLSCLCSVKGNRSFRQAEGIVSSLEECGRGAFWTGSQDGADGWGWYVVVVESIFLFQKFWNRANHLGKERRFRQTFLAVSPR